MGRRRTFHHFMRLNAIAGLLVTVLVSMPATAEVRLPRDVEKVLRGNGLSPRSRPASNEKYSIAIRGTEQKPELLTGNCSSRPAGRRSIQGKRFTYEADNRGEWGGDLNVREGSSPKRSVVRGNTQDLITLSDDLYVFTGLEHLEMSYGAVDIVENYDSNPNSRHLTVLPEAPAVIAFDTNWGGFLVISPLSVSLVTPSGSLHVIMARYAYLPSPNSVMSMGEADILVGVCGGVAWIHAPWRMHFPPDTDPVAEAANNIPLVTYWTRQ